MKRRVNEMDSHLKARLAATVMQLHPDYRDLGQRDIDLILASGLNTFEDWLATVQDSDADLSLRMSVAWLLGRLDDSRALPALIAALNDPNARLRAEAARALATLADPDSVPALVETLFQDDSADVRMAAAYALGLIGDEPSVQALMRVLENVAESPNVRGMAAENLGNLSAVEAIESLIAALSDPAVETRFWAAFALGEIGDPRALPELRRLADSDHSELPGWWTVSKEAANSIDLITGANR